MVCILFPSSHFGHQYISTIPPISPPPFLPDKISFELFHTFSLPAPQFSLELIRCLLFLFRESGIPSWQGGTQGVYSVIGYCLVLVTCYLVFTLNLDIITLHFLRVLRFGFRIFVFSHNSCLRLFRQNGLFSLRLFRGQNPVSVCCRGGFLTRPPVSPRQDRNPALKSV